MKLNYSLFVSCLLVLTCLATEKEAKSEPFSAIIIGAIWTAVPYVIPTIPICCAVFQKVKEYVVNLEVERIGRDLSLLTEKVDKNAQEASEERRHIKSSLVATQQELESIKGILDSLRGGQEELKEEQLSFRALLQEVRDSSKNGFSNIQDDISSLKTNQKKILEHMECLGSETRQHNSETNTNIKKLTDRVSRAIQASATIARQSHAPRKPLLLTHNPLYRLDLE